MCICLAILSICVPLISARLLDWNVPFWAYCFILAACRWWWCEASNHLISSRKAECGAEGEEVVASVLRSLPPEWKVIRNLETPNLGDIDFIVIAPDQKAFAIEAKSHRGQVVSAGAAIHRVLDGRESVFEKDFLAQTMREALSAREHLKLPFVVPILVFARAKVIFSDRKLRGVFVLQADELIDFLLSMQANDPPALSAARPVSPVSVPAVPPQTVAPQQIFVPPRTASPKPTRISGSTAIAVSTCRVGDMSDIEKFLNGECDESCEIMELAVKLKYGDIDEPYRVKAHSCWQCHSRILVFTWTGHYLWCLDRPPAPIPRTVKWSWSSSVNHSYWANTCPCCEAVQGDFFVHEDRSPGWQDIRVFGPR
jgi:hypothetical protein